MLVITSKGFRDDPWTVTLHQQIALNTDLVDEICPENERSSRRMKGSPGV